MAYFLALTILLAPTYVIRFELYELSTNVLMLWLGLVWIAFGVWLIRRRAAANFFRFVVQDNRVVLGLAAAFFVAGVISTLVGGLDMPKLGQFIVLFAQPIGTYFIARYVVAQQPNTKDILIKTLFAFAGFIGAYAIAQYFTLIGLPADWWGNANEPKRAVSVFEHPNAFALFIAPVLALLVPHVATALQQVRQHRTQWWVVVAWAVGALGLLLSLSRGGWLGLLAAVGVFAIASMNKRIIATAVGAVIVVALVVAIVPNLRYRVLLPFYGEKSSIARLSLWDTGRKMIVDSPVLGKGLKGFSTNWETYNTDAGLGKHPAPHNFFLNFLVETGLLGMVSMCAIAAYAIAKGIRSRRNIFALGLALFVIAIVVHGQIDVPYLKNDLALLFWLALGAFL